MKELSLADKYKNAKITNKKLELANKKLEFANISENENNRHSLFKKSAKNGQKYIEYMRVITELKGEIDRIKETPAEEFLADAIVDFRTQTENRVSRFEERLKNPTYELSRSKGTVVLMESEIEDGKELLSRTDDELALYLIDNETQNIEENTNVLSDSLPADLETPDEGRDGNS